MQEETTDRRGRLHQPPCSTARDDMRIVRMAVMDYEATSRIIAQPIQSATLHSVSPRTIRRSLQQSGMSAKCPLFRLLLAGNHRRVRRQWCDERRTWTTESNGIVFADESRFCLQHQYDRIRVLRHRSERLLNCCVMHRHTGLAPHIMVWGGIGFHCCTLLVRIAGTLNSQHYISEVLESAVLPYIQRLLSVIFEQANARPRVERSVQEFFCTHQIELLPWPSCPSDLSPIENEWSMLAERLTRDTPPAATPDQHWQYVEATWTIVPQRYI